MPAADDLFRPTADGDPPEQQKGRAAIRAVGGDEGKTSQPARSTKPAPRKKASGRAPREASGRIRHDEKMTVYVTSEELLAIEHARLTLRAEQGLAVDRGRLVREALAVVLADLEAHHEDSMLVKRLQSEA